MNGKINTTINTLPPFKYFINSIGELPSSYLESMSYYETLVWLCNYLKETIIPTVNNTGNAVTELQNLYINLQNYVNDYFDNLDVQEEINNKLDVMAESGQLTTIIKKYVDPLLEDFEEEVENAINTQNTILNNAITEQNTRINAITSGSPLVASSTSEMTNTNRIYVNTTDGNWYYYNGNAWTIGGVYQSTAIANNSLGISKFDNKITNELFKMVNADTMLWGNYSLVNGVYEGNTDAYTSQLIYVGKDTVITFSENFRSRITIFDLNFNYVSNTGSFANRDNYEVQYNCYIAISILKNDNNTEITDCNSTNVGVIGFINNYNSILDNITFSKHNWSSSHAYITANNRMISDKFFVTKGTKISLNDNKWMDYIVDIFDLDFNIVSIGESWLNVETTINEDCIIDIRGKNNKNSEIDDHTLLRFKNILNIVPKDIDNFKFVNEEIFENNNQIEKIGSSIENGAFGLTDGRLVDSDSRVRTANMLYFNKGDKILPHENYQLKVYFFENNGNYIGYTGNDWLNSYTFENSTNAKVCFRKIEDTNITYNDLPQYYIRKSSTIIPFDKKEFKYYGKEIKLNNTCNCRYLKKLPTTGSTGTAQGMAFANNTLFLLYNTGGIAGFRCYDINNTINIDSTPIGIGMIGSSDAHQHVNNACFGNKLNPSDEFPLLYTSGGLWTSDNNGYCAVDTIEIDEDNGSISSTNIQKIYIDQTHFEEHGFSTFYAFPCFTTDGTYLYTATGKTIANTWDNPNNKHVITKFRLPSPTEGSTVTLTYEDIIDQVENDYNVIKTQGGTAGSGYIIQLYGNVPQSSFPTIINFYDQASLKLKNIVNCKDMAVAGAEPEDLIIFNNKILIRRVDNNIYELTF